jgi:hypothetical protein
MCEVPLVEDEKDAIRVNSKALTSPDKVSTFAS